MNGVSKSFNYSNGSVSATLSLSTGLNNVVLSATNSCGSDAKSISLTYNDCTSPVVSISSPVNGSVSTNQSVSFTANVQHMPSSSGMSLKVNGVSKSFNYSNGSVSATLSLSTGLNNVVLSATNSCGSDAKSISLTYNDCTSPVVSISSPVNGSLTTNQSVSFTANVQHMPSSSGLSLKVNGVSKSFNYSNGSVSATLSLSTGLNNVVLSATNSCGSDAKSISLTYNDCTSPVVSISSPVNGSVSTNQSVSFTANVQHMPSSSGISLRVNGVSKSFNYSNGSVSATLSLSTGLNNVVLSATNSCGSDEKKISVKYNDCTSPVVSISSPINGSLTTNQSVSFTANVQHMPSSSGISLRVNGVPKTFNYSNGSVSATLSLSTGLNNVVLSATNSCEVMKKISVKYNDCTSPVVSISSPVNGHVTTTQNISIVAAVQNMQTASGISLKLNGLVKPFNFSNGTLNANVDLFPE